MGRILPYGATRVQMACRTMRRKNANRAQAQATPEVESCHQRKQMNLPSAMVPLPSWLSRRYRFSGAVRLMELALCRPRKTIDDSVHCIPCVPDGFVLARKWEGRRIDAKTGSRA